MSLYPGSNPSFRASYEQELARLRSDYVASSFRRTAALRALLSGLPPEPVRPEEMEPLREAFHKIAGTAGICGLDQVSARAREAERAILELQDRRIGVDAPILRLMAAAIDSIEEAFAREAGR